MNKKGYSFSGWVEVILIVVLFLGVFTGVVNEMNRMYGVDFDLGGISDTYNATDLAMTNYVDSSTDKILEGEPETSSDGLTLKTSWGIMTGISSVVWNFFSGGFIERILVDWIKLPSEVGRTVRILFVLSIIFAVIALLFRRKP